MSNIKCAETCRNLPIGEHREQCPAYLSPDERLNELAMRTDLELRRSAVMIASGLDMQFSTLRREIDVGFNRIQMQRNDLGRWALDVGEALASFHNLGKASAAAFRD